jgi:hypothetical protein
VACTRSSGSRPADSSTRAIDEAEARALLDFISEMLHERFGFERVASATGDTVILEIQGAHVDVDTELVNISFGNIHDTWLRCMGSLLRKGMQAEDVFRTLLAATERAPACQDDPEKKHWGRKILDMLEGYIRHERAFITSLPPEAQKTWHKRERAGMRTRLFYRNDFGLQCARA